MSEIIRCQLCGEPMPEGEEMFNYHGYSGPCPKPAAPAAAQPRQGEGGIKMKDELGWLIETARTTYWDGHGTDFNSFTDDPNRAVRFARFEDAEVVRCWLLDDIKLFLRSTEHMWPQVKEEL